MHTLIQADKYSKWFASLRDARAQARINIRLRRIELGVLGDCKPVGEGVSEMRIDYGPGYRVYSFSEGMNSSFFWPVVIKAAKPRTSSRR
jgi:putative addiction module killer protein